MAKKRTKQQDIIFTEKFGWINFVLTALTSGLSIAFIYATVSTSWITSTEIYVVDSSFNRRRGLFRECTYVTHVMDCEAPYPNLVLAAKPIYYLVGQFTMPIVCLLELVASVNYIRGHPCVKKSIIGIDQKQSLLIGSIILATASILGIVCGIFAIDCTQRNYCLGGISNQYWLVDNEEAGVQQFSLGRGGLTSFICCFINLAVSGFSFANYKKLDMKLKKRIKAKIEGNELADKLWQSHLETSRGFI